MADNALKPSAPALTLKEFFGETYSVPPYQRFFAWGLEEIEQLFTDLQEFYVSNDPYYFMGQVIVSDCTGIEKFDLVDGQQRATALHILLIAIREKFEKHPDVLTDPSLKVWLSELNLLIVWSAGGPSKPSPKVRPAGDGIDLLQALIDGTTRPTIDGWTRENILNAYEEFLKRLDMYFPNVSDIPSFYRRIVDGVILVRLEIQSHEEAIGIFERINNRGLPLSSADLIKNTIFSKVSNLDYENVSSKWEKGSEILHSSRVTRIRPMSYLLRAVLVGETGVLATNKALRDRWADLLGDRAKAIEFANSIPDYAEKLRRIGDGVCPSSKSLKDLNEGSKYFRFIQHYPILLSASHLKPTVYEYLSELIEDRVILSVLSAERPQEFEKIVPLWSKNLKKLSASSKIQDVEDASRESISNITVLLERANSNFCSWRYTNQSERKRMRYVLARLSRAIQIELNEPNVPVLYDYLRRPGSVGRKKKGYDLDHIRPQSKYGSEDFTHAIGNIAFVSEADQRAAKDAEPSEKEGIYKKSHMTLTRSLVSDPEAVKKELAIIKEIWETCPPSLNMWSDDCINQRTDMYWSQLRSLITEKLLLK
jgi:hypothetical protein